MRILGLSEGFLFLSPGTHPGNRGLNRKREIKPRQYFGMKIFIFR
jgi:hypothetical protein